MAKLRFTDDVTTSVGFQVLVAISALATAIVLVLDVLDGDASVWAMVLRILCVLTGLLLLLASINGRRYRRQQEVERS